MKIIKQIEAYLCSPAVVHSVLAGAIIAQLITALYLIDSL